MAQATILFVRIGITVVHICILNLVLQSDAKLRSTPFIIHVEYNSNLHLVLICIFKLALRGDAKLCSPYSDIMNRKSTVLHLDAVADWQNSRDRFERMH